MNLISLWDLLILIKNNVARLFFIKADILHHQKEIDLAREAFKEAVKAIDGEEKLIIQFENILVKIPENWKRDISDLYFRSILLNVRNGGFQNGLDSVKKGVLLFPSNEIMRKLSYKLAFISGENNISNQNSNIIVGGQKPYDIDEKLINADIALDNGEEVLAAKIISEVGNNAPANPHFKAIQARLLLRKNSREEATKIFHSASDHILSDRIPIEVRSIEDISKIIQYLAVCEAANELNDLSICSTNQQGHNHQFWTIPASSENIYKNACPRFGKKPFI